MFKTIVILFGVAMVVYSYVLAVAILSYLLEDNSIRTDKRGLYSSVGLAIFANLLLAGLLRYTMHIGVITSGVIIVVGIVAYVFLSFGVFKKRKAEKMKHKIDDLLKH